MRLSWMVRPAILVMLPVLTSAAVWLVPGQSIYLRGYDVRSTLSWGAAAILFVWYLLVLAVLVIGARAGRAMQPFRQVARVETEPHFERRFLLILTLLSTIGVLYAVYLARSDGSIIASLGAGMGNQLSESLDNSAGVQTLRYTTAISAPVAVHMWARGRTGALWAIWNTCLLGVNALFTSRLSLLMAIVVLVYLTVKFNPEKRLRVRWFLLGGAGVYGALAALNYFRNSNYYESFGITNPLVMNLYQIAAYVGAPFQVQVGVADSIWKGSLWIPGAQNNPLNGLLPTFLQSNESDAWAATVQGRYQGLVSIAPNLTTNSAFADTYSHYGLAGLMMSLLLVFGGALVFGHASRYVSYPAAAGGVLAYAFAEYWRILLINQGIVLYLILAVVFASLLSAGIPSSRPRANHAVRPSNVGQLRESSQAVRRLDAGRGEAKSPTKRSFSSSLN